MSDMDYHIRRAELIGALSNPYRLRMVEMLADGELCVCECDSALDLDYSSISRHLSVLRKAGIAGYRKSGKQVFYHLRVPCIMNFLKCFDEVLKLNVEEDAQHLENRSGA